MRADLFRLHAELEERHWWFVARRRIMRDLVRHLATPRSGATVVDVGCGTGGNLGALAAEYRCVGVDTSEDAVALARFRFPGVRFVLGTAPDAVEEDVRRARVLLLMDVMEHVRDDFALLADLLRAMSPGAHLLLTVPADARLWSEHDVSFGHYRRYDERRLALTWEGLPVTARLVSHFNARLHPLVRAVRGASRARGRASGRAGTDLAVPPRPLNAALERIFAGESKTLVDVLEGRREHGYHHGVSLVAVLRREPGEVPARVRPVEAGPDLHDPEAAAPTHEAAA